MIVTRHATPDDRGLARALLDEIHRYYFSTGRPEGALEASVADILDRGHTQMLLAFDDGAAVGCATYTYLQPSPNGHGVMFMKDLFVSDGQRSKGIGQRLLADLTQIAADRGCSRFDWTAEKGNSGAQRLYDSLGAKRVEEKIYYRVSDSDMSSFIAACRSEVASG